MGCVNIQAQTNISAGNVSGTWTKAGSPYKVNGNITISNGNTLTIEPGVRIEFAFKTYIKVDGRILAKGGKNSSDSIWFTKQMTHDTGSWKGVKFINTANTNDTSEFKYCVFRHCKSLWDTAKANISGGITVMGYGKVKINNSTFYRNEANIGACLFLTRSAYAKVVSCEFKINKASRFTYWNGSAEAAFRVRGSAIAVEYFSNVFVDSSIFRNNIRGKDYRSSPSILLEASVIDIEGESSNNLKTGGIINNSVFDGNEGITIYSYYKTNTYLNSCTFKNAPKGKSLYVFYTLSSSNNLIYNSFFIYIKSYSILNSESSSIQVIKSLFQNNENFISLVTESPTKDVSKLIFNQCKILNNKKTEFSSVHTSGITASEISNSLIANNTFDLISGHNIKNSTIVNNVFGVDLMGGNHHLYPNNYKQLIYVINSVIWGNKSDSFNGRQLIIYPGSTAYFNNNLIENDTNTFCNYAYGKILLNPYVYQNNISTNPQFVNPTLGAGYTYDALNADFSLKSTCAITSPAINAGSTDTLYMRLPKYDLAGNLRFYEGRIDIGCYEDNSGSAKVSIIKAPKNDSLCENSRPALLTLSALGKGVTYQWQQSSNGSSWTNTTTKDSLKINNPLLANNTYLYRAIINGTCDKDTSNPVSVIVKPAPKPNLGKDTALCKGTSLTLNSSENGTYLWHSNTTNNAYSQTINNNQTWWLQVTAANGCKGRDSINITSKSLPVVNLGADKSLHQLGSVILDAGASQKSYLWNDNSTNQTKTFFGKDLGPNGTYTIWVKVTGTNDCVASDSINISVFNNTNISSTNKGLTSAYPNPSKDKLTIETKENSRIIIHDAQGKTVLNQITENYRQEFDLSPFAKGMYTIQIIQPNSIIETIKLIIE